MIPEREGKGHGEGKRVTSGDISKAVLYGGGMSGVPGKAAVERWVCLPKMREPTWIPAEKWAVSVYPMPPSSLRDGGDRVAQDAYAADAVVSGALSGVPG